MQYYHLEDLKSASLILLAATFVAAIFVLAYILASINPESRRTPSVRLNTESSQQRPVDAAADKIKRNSQRDAEDAQFLDAISCTDPDELVKWGRTYAMGHGVPSDLSRAFALFLRAAERGHARGMCFVAAAYHFGQGVPENRFEALRWYQRSAALGDSLAKKKIGDFGLLDVPALIKSRVSSGVKNFVRRREKQQ